MSTVTIRYATALAESSEEARNALLSRFPSTSLADLDAIRERADALDAESRARLTELLTFDPGFLGIAWGEASEPRGPVEAGLVFEFPAEAGASVVIPLEVRVALLDDATRTSAPVAALLADWENEDLVDLASLHGVALDDEDDDLELASRVADALCDLERLDSLFDSLPGPAKRLLHWLCELDHPVPQDKATETARRFAELAGEPSGTGERLLVRLGVAHEVYVDGDALLVVPHDVREALRPIVEASLTARCRALYEQMRSNALPAFRDAFPHGAGGNALMAARQRTLRASWLPPDPTDPLDRVLIVFRVLHPEDGIGELAATHLDVSTPERFAQECLRSWLSSLDDEFTRVLIAPFGGDSLALADWVIDTAGSREQRADHEAEDWSTFLQALRAHLLFALSVLNPGHWYEVSALADFFAGVYRRLVWHHGGFADDLDGVPTHAFPLAGVDLTSEEEHALYEAIVILIAELLEPIGAACLDDSGALFMVNLEALRLFRDGDPGFDTLWTDAESYAGDDIDLWMPIPTSWGVRVSGCAQLRWVDDCVLEVSGDPHLYDLLQLSAWAHPVFIAGEFRFLFDPESVSTGAETGSADEFLLWLVVRTGAIPGAARALFPLSTSSADAEDPMVEGMGLARRRLDEMHSWGDDVPVEVMESLRGLGAAASGVVIDALAAEVERAEWTSPFLRNLCILAGELGAREAVPLLMRVIGHATYEPTEGAAGMALARIGEAAVPGLTSLATSVTVHTDKRLAACGALSSLGVLHPHTRRAAFEVFGRVVDAAEELPEDVPTLVAVLAAETGHPDGEEFLRRTRDQGLWLDEVMRFDEALWICGVSPAVWGHPIFAAPLSQLYAPLAEIEAREREEEPGEAE